MNRRMMPLAVLTIAGMLAMSPATTAFADTATTTTSTSQSVTGVTLSEQQAIDIAKKLFNVPKDLIQQNVGLQSNWMGQNRTVYNVSWQSPPSPKPGPMNGLNVAIDANTGQVLQYNQFNGKGNNWSTSGTINLDKARSLAADWIKKLAPDQAAHLQLQATPLPNGPGPYSFSFVNEVNGVLVAFQSVRIGIDVSGQLNDYSFNWRDAELADASGILQAKDVQGAYTKALGLHLQYQAQYGTPFDNPKNTLVYAPADYNNRYFMGGDPGAPGPWIDAVTGNLIGVDGQPSTVSATTYSPIDPNGEKTLPTLLAQPLTDQDAEKLVRDTFGLSSDYTLTDKSRNSDMGVKLGGHYVQFTFRNDATQDNVNVSVDVDSGIVNNYNHYTIGPVTQPSGAPTISTSDAQSRAVAFVKKVYPHLTGALAMVPTPDVQPLGAPYSVNFALLVNGVPASNFNVNINPYTGNVDGLWAPPYLYASYPSPDKAISQAQAESAYLEKQPMQLQYVLPVASTQPDAKTGQMTFKSKAILAYAPNVATPGYLDALTGKWAQYSPSSSVGQVPTDIVGHYGEKEMTLLAERGMLQVKDGKVSPDAKMTRAQFVSLLVKANSMYYGSSGSQTGFKDVPDTNPYYSDIMQAVQQGWLALGTYFYPDKPITRSDAAQMLVSFMGWHSLSTHTKLFSLPYQDAKDVPTAERGDVAIATEFGWVQAVKGKFLPKQSMTVADAAVAVVHALQTQSTIR